MDDIDDELLALAGGASSEDEETPRVNIRTKSSSPDRQTTGKANGKKSGGRSSTRRQNDSEEEGEA